MMDHAGIVSSVYTTTRTWSHHSLEHRPKNPPQTLGTVVQYKITALDNADNMHTEDNAGQYHVYTIIPELTPIALAIVATAATLTATVLARTAKKRNQIGRA